MAEKTSPKKKLTRRPVLIVDASGQAQALLAPALKKAGVEFEFARPGQKNFQELLAGNWDMVLLNASLSRMINRIREQRGLRQLPIVLFYRRSKAPLVSALAGADDYLELPAPGRELARRIGAILERGTRQIDAHTLKEGSRALEQILATVRSERNDFEILQFAASELSRMYPGSRCSIMTIDPPRNRAVVVAETKSTEELNISLNLKSYPEILKVIETKKPLAIADVQRHPLMREVRKILATKSIHSLLLVPVIYQDELIGIIFLKSVEAKYLYHPVDIYFARLISDSLALALKNLRLSREAFAQAREKEQAVSRARYSGQVSRRLEKLFEYASDGLIIVSEKGETTGVNLNFLRLSGFARNELVGGPVEDFLAFEHPREQSLAKWLLQRRRSGSSNLLLKLKGGAKKFVAAHIELLPGSRKEFLISVHDVTEERQLAFELKQTKEFLESLIANSMEAIIAADWNGNIILFNKAAEELTGYKAEEVLHKRNIVDLYVSGGARDVMKKLRSPFYGGPGRLETTHNVLVGKSGEEIPINMSASMVYDHAGKPVATMGLYQDIRERIEIEKRLRQAQERLLDSKRKEAVMALAGAAAHELNQPLTSILGYAEILKRAEGQLQKKLQLGERVFAPVRNAAKVIADQAERMAEVIKKLGDLTEFETREYAGKQKILDLDRSKRPEKNLEQALSMVDEAVVLMDPELVIRECFGRAAEIFGENPGGKSLSRYLEGVNYAAGVKLIEQAGRQDSAQAELELKSSQGRLKRVLIRAEKAQGKNLILAFYNVEMLRQMQSQLKELTAFRGQLFQTMPVPLVVMDVDGRVTHISREAEKLFGFSLDEIKGKPPAMLIANFDQGQFVAYLRKLRQQGILEGTMTARDKTERTFEIYHFFGAMRDPAGEIVGYLAFMVDLSEKRLLEKSLREKTTYLEAIQKNTAILVQSSDWQQALAAMLDQLRKLLEFDVAVVVPSERTERGFYFLNYYPASKEKRFQEQRAFEQSDRILAWLTELKTICYEDISRLELAGLPGDMRDTIRLIQDRGIKSVISAPLKFQEEVIGRIFFGHHEPGHFTPEKLGSVQELIEQITIAVSNFRLYLRMEKQREKLVQRNLFLQQVLEQSQKIDLRQDESQIFLEFLNLCQNIFPRAHLWLAWKDEADEYLVRSVSNLDMAILGKKVQLTPALKEKISSASAPLVLEPGPEIPSFLPDSKNLTLVPVLAESSLLGMLGIESHHVEPFVQEEQFLFQLFARYMALLVPNLLRIRQSVLLKSFQESLIESTNAFILMISRDNELVLFNRAFEEKLGVQPSALKNMRPDDFANKYVLMIQEERGKVLSPAALLQKVLKGQKYSNLRARFRSEQGETFEAIFNVAGLKDASGRLPGVICVGQDLSPIRELEAKLLHFERLAGLGQMAAGVVHELNNPLQAIITYSELVKRRLDEIGETDMARKVANVIDAGERVRRLARSLISYARPGAEKQEKVDIKDLVDEILSFSGYELSRGGVEIRNLAPENLPRFSAVKDQIEQVLINLLTNASHACEAKAGGKVEVSANASGKWLEFTVKDNGTGISPENLPRIFEPFFTTKKPVKGTGLGLNIVQSIVERHGGKVHVQSQPGQGTAFTIRLPLEP